ncbi:M48 family metallopeptidase [Halovenus rubra]|uniref:M48 family metallopeptidase n=2 Tax=Halovenus rubra TaxID=869890 RepID=A0ABD5X482_9EURY|nr:M48 family metalloprotease [Halovenus rubra]
MGSRELYLGLWVRMTVAVLLSVCGLLVLLAAEFVLAAGVSFFALVLAPLLGGLLLFGAGFLLVFFGLQWLIAVRRGAVEWSDLRVSPNDEASGDQCSTDEGISTDELPSAQKIKRTTAILVGTGVGVLLTHSVILGAFEVSPVLFAVGSGAVIVVGFTGWLVYDELSSTSSIRTDLESEYDIVSDPEREHDVQRRVRRLARQADSPAPAVEVGASTLPKAASVGYRPSNSVILVSRGLVDSLDSDELDAVLAHELAHLLNRDAAVLTALSFPRAKIAQIADLLFEPSASSDADVIIFPLLIVSTPVYIVNRLVVPTVTRYREYVADYVAGELIGSHSAMASALATLDQEYAVHYRRDLRMQWSSTAFGIVPPPWEERKVLDGAIRFFYRRLLGTHPPTESRIERLRLCEE